MHPDAPQHAQYRAQAYSTRQGPQVQFDSASRPYQHEPEAETSLLAAPPYPLGPTGISAYRVTHTPPNNGLWNAEQYHYTVLLRRIQHLIHWKVGRTIVAPQGSKQPKMGEPLKYAKNQNHNVFVQWLNQFLNWLRSHYHCGEEVDFSRLNFLSNYLEGIAADWFAADVDNPDKLSLEPMKFVNAICAMHRRFVRTATANNAVTQYDKVEYSDTEGVEGFYYKLDKMASRMVERPSDYAFRLRLFEGLPTWIYDTLLERNILPEFFKGSTINPASQRQTQQSGQNRGSTSNQSNPRFLSQNKPNRSNGERSSNRPVTNRERPSAVQRPLSHPNNNINSSGKNSEQRAVRTTRDTSELECYSCHQKGHISSDPKCPKYAQQQNRPRFNTQRLIEDEEDDDQAEGNEPQQQELESEYSNSWGSSQYEPEEHEAEEEEPLEYLDTDDTPEGEGTEEVRMSLMRTIRMFALCRITNPTDIPSNEDNTFEIDTPRRIIEPPIPDTEDTTNENTPVGGSSSSQLPIYSHTPGVRPRGDPSSIHAGLWEGEEDEISDLVYIEYRDVLTFHKEEGQDLAEVETQVQRIGSVMRCLICHRCHPIARVVSFTGNQDGETYYYVVDICRIPVERALAQEEIDDDKADFDVSRFFASRTLAPDSIGANEHSDDEYDDLPDLVEVSDDEYDDLPDLVEVSDDDDEVSEPRRPTPQNTRSNREYEWIRMYTSTGPLEMRTMEQRLLDSVILEVEGYRALQECIGCFDCTPRIVHIMQMQGNIPVFDRLGLLCRNPSVP